MSINDEIEQANRKMKSTRDVIIEVLCGQALADHLGDVRDEEEKLWGLLQAPTLPYEECTDSAWATTRARLLASGYELPEYLRGDDDEV